MLPPHPYHASQLWYWNPRSYKLSNATFDPHGSHLDMNANRDDSTSISMKCIYPFIVSPKKTLPQPHCHNVIRVLVPVQQ